MQWHLWAYIEPKVCKQSYYSMIFFCLLHLTEKLTSVFLPYFIKQTACEVTVCWHQKAGPTNHNKSSFSSSASGQPFKQVRATHGYLGLCMPSQMGGHLTSPWHLQNKKPRKQNKENRRMGLKVWIITIQPRQTMVETVVPTPLYLGALSQSDSQIRRTKFKFQDAISSSQPAHSHFKLSEVAISCQFSPFISHSLIPNPLLIRSYALKPRWALRTGVQIPPRGSSEQYLYTCTIIHTCTHTWVHILMLIHSSK